MFNLGASYYNGDGVGSNEYTAYVWFLLAQDAGNALAVDAVNRSASIMSQGDTSAAFAQISAMYEKGEQLPKSEEQTVRWLRKAAELDSPGKVRLAVHFLTGPDSQHDYAQALSLCKAAGHYPGAFACVGHIYRKGLGVPQDSIEAAKWYQKGVAGENIAAMSAMAEMYSAGEGVKVDRPAAFFLLFQLSRMGANGAKQKASNLLQQMNQAERKQLEKNLRGRHLDPKEVFAAFQSVLALETFSFPLKGRSLLAQTNSPRCPRCRKRDRRIRAHVNLAPSRTASGIFDARHDPPDGDSSVSRPAAFLRGG